MSEQPQGSPQPQGSAEQQGSPPALPQARHEVVLDRDGVRVHTFTAPPEFLANSTHIIETEHCLVLVDGQFVVPYATEFRAYADSLGKPIERLFLSHGHVDHFFGIGAAFTDVPVAAPASTIALLREQGEQMRAQRAAQYGPLVPARIVVPQHQVEPGPFVIDGVNYLAETVHNAECDEQLVLRLPDLAVTIVQDLVYSGAHLYLTRDVDNWVAVLHRLAGSDSELFLAGHGPVADLAEVEANIEYLHCAQRTLAGTTDPGRYKQEILAAYPDRTGAAILDIYLPRLYDRVAG